MLPTMPAKVYDMLSEIGQTLHAAPFCLIFTRSLIFAKHALIGSDSYFDHVSQRCHIPPVAAIEMIYNRGPALKIAAFNGVFLSNKF